MKVEVDERLDQLTHDLVANQEYKYYLDGLCFLNLHPNEITNGADLQTWLEGYITGCWIFLNRCN